MNSIIVTPEQLEAKGFTVVGNRAFKPQISTSDADGVTSQSKAECVKLPIQRKEFKGDGYDSQLEKDFASELELWKATGIIDHWEREPMSVKICKRGEKWWTYRADFIVNRKGVIEFYEIKPNFTKREARIGELKLSLFAAWCKHWCFKVYRTTRQDGRWCFEEV